MKGFDYGIETEQQAVLLQNCWRNRCQGAATLPTNLHIYTHRVTTLI